jgi:hypothetical protein
MPICLFKWRRHYLAGDYGLPDVTATVFAAHEAAPLNWMPVTLAPNAVNAPGWRRIVPAHEEPREGSLRLAPGHKWQGVSEPCPVVDSA